MGMHNEEKRATEADSALLGVLGLLNPGTHCDDDDHPRYLPSLSMRIGLIKAFTVCPFYGIRYQLTINRLAPMS